MQAEGVRIVVVLGTARRTAHAFVSGAVVMALLFSVGVDVSQPFGGRATIAPWAMIALAGIAAGTASIAWSGRSERRRRDWLRPN